MKGFIVAATATLACTSAFADGQGRPRYRVEEVRPPSSLPAPCLPQYGNFMGGVINDFGIVAGNYNCTSQVDPSTGTAATVGGPYVSSSWFGTHLLPDSDPTTSGSFATSINNRNEVFGSEVGSTFVGVKWSLSGGLETVFPNQPECDIIKLDIAVAGNGRYAVGWGFRPGPDLPFPGLCLTPAWLTRNPDGTVVTEFLDSNPSDINAFNTAVGLFDRNTAVRFQVVTKELRILRTGDDSHPVTATDINDLGEVSGYAATVDPAGGGIGDACSILSSSALRWDRNDRETRLPLLPGTASARAWNVGIDGETVGESGPGQHCWPTNSTNERAVLWRGGRAFDLNDSIPPHSGVTLASATSINRRGQITAYGYRNDDPLVICPRFEFNPETGGYIDVSRPCRTQRLFVLTPVGR